MSGRLTTSTTEPMYDLNSLSLEALLKISMRTELISRYRMTDWVVVTHIDGREYVMNHGDARVFLQGLIYGAAMRSRERGDDIEDGWIFTTTGPSRIVVS